MVPLSMVPRSPSPCLLAGIANMLGHVATVASKEVTFPLMIMGRKSKDGQERMTTARISSRHSEGMYVVTSFMSYSRPGIPLSSAAQKDF